MSDPIPRRKRDDKRASRTSPASFKLIDEDAIADARKRDEDKRASRTSPAASLKLIDEVALAYALDISVKTLQAWRASGRGPPFVKVGRCVRYDENVAVPLWIAERTVTSTSAASAAQVA